MWEECFLHKFVKEAWPVPTKAFLQPAATAAMCCHPFQHNTRERKNGEKRGRPWPIHHVNDVRWTQGGCREEGPNHKINAQDHPFKRSTAVLDFRP